MPRLIWAPAALQDVQRLYRFLAPRNPASAARAVRAIREGMQMDASGNPRWLSAG
jgi:plasmid stabilization system protein ParE